MEKPFATILRSSACRLMLESVNKECAPGGSEASYHRDFDGR